MSRGSWHWLSRLGLGRKLAIALAIAAMVSGIATYVTISSNPPFGPDPRTVLLLLNLDLVLLLLLGALVARRIVGLWAERRRGLAGSRLHIRFVALFSLVAATPTIIVAVFSFLFFNYGIQNWFSDTVRTAVFESRAVARAYLDEHHNVIRADIGALANDLTQEVTSFVINPGRLSETLTRLASQRGLSEAIVFDASGRVIARSSISFALEFDPVPEIAMVQARSGQIAVLTSGNDDRVRALIRLDPEASSFLYVGRFIDPRVIGHLERTDRAVSEYEKLESGQSGIQITFAAMFLVVALLLLIASVWVGLALATRLARPISGLIGAAERVRGGDLTARVDEDAGGSDLDSLSRAFNRMTRQLHTQRNELMEANRQLEARRRFTEMVLGGVSAGVIGLDEYGCITLPNRPATELVGVDLDQWVGSALGLAVPEMAPLLERARAGGSRLVQDQVEVARDGRRRSLIVRVAAEGTGPDRRYVVTFDDVSELMAAQRKAAWADVARRIAHEIKNPLTPIQLSAERLRRRYSKEIQSDPETFLMCTDTIIRQVADIGRMVDEFSSFARMPAPVFAAEDMVTLCREALFLQRTGRSDIRYEAELPERPIRIVCDRRQIGQALTNILKNAAEAIDGREGTGEAGEGLPPGRIGLSIATAGDRVRVTVEDNGRGLPAEDRDQLTEPYVTTRAKGSGLGLAIVKKIMEDHGGELLLDDRPGGGARVVLDLPYRPPAAVPIEPDGEESALTDPPAAARKTASHGA